MATTPVAISELPAAESLDGSEHLPTVQSGETRRTTVADIRLDVTTITINTRTADYALAVADAGRVVRVDSSSARKITVPDNASEAFPVGSVVNIRQAGIGEVQIVEATGVTVNHEFGFVLELRGRYSEVSLHKVATDTWDAIGGLAEGS